MVSTTAVVAAYGEGVVLILGMGTERYVATLLVRVPRMTSMLTRPRYHTFAYAASCAAYKTCCSLSVSRLCSA